MPSGGAGEAIASGSHTLIHAPTGSGKTLAAFLWGIDRLASEPVPDEAKRCRLLYVSPMKALAYDIERNLRAPLTGIKLAASRLGIELPPITTAMRTGDTPGKDRQTMLRHPPDILITTPESLYLMLTSQARSMLAPVRWVIVDEIHSVAGSKRGSHLALSLERLTDLADRPPQRIGLSATQRPLEAIAEFLGGGEPTEDGWRPRPVTIVDAPWDKHLDLEIVVPVADMTKPETTRAGGADEPPPRSIWPAVYPRLLEQVLEHRSTLIFVNSRGAAERLAAELNRLAGEELARSHHGSVSREQRVEIEGKLKGGELRAVVATSTLELGIDMAAVDLVLLVESPASVARGLQRVGRAGHQVGVPSVARIYPKHRADLLETAVVVDRMLAGAIEATTVPRNPLDVLAQQIVAMVTAQPATADDLYTLVRRSAPYRDLGRAVSRGCWTCWPGATRRTNSPSSAPASCGTGALEWSRAVTTPGCSPSPTRGPSPTAACTPWCFPVGAGWASSTRRWCTRAGSGTCSCSAPPRGGSTRSPKTGYWWCPLPPRPPPSSLSGTATPPVGRSSWVERWVSSSAPSGP